VKKVKVLVIGGDGSIGSRYCAILKYLSVPYTVWGESDGDLRDTCGTSFEKAIIAAPTEWHAYYCHALWDLEVPFLCEKPLSKSPNECAGLLDRAKRESIKGHVVNNYQFLLAQYAPKTSISYSYYKTGSDGLWWDLCQLAYIADKKNLTLSVSKSLPVWTMKADGRTIPYREVEKSYIYMVMTWLQGGKGLWTIADGVNMTRVVKGKIQDDIDRNTVSKFEQEATQ
jgi:hypothetical protein